MDLLKVIIELTVFTVGIYLVLRFLRETRGSGVVRGLIIVLLGGMVAFFTLIETLELERLDVVFKEVTATIVLTLVIVFHQEIRRAFVQLGDSQIFGRFFRREVKTMQRLLRSVARLSKERIGALIAIEREGSLANLAETGVHIDAELNSFLIESVFYPGTALHDGAIVVRGDRLVAASCLLPLSQSQDIDKRLGTRHRAALGLTEESDALAIVVSEETGKISTSVGGKLDYGISLEQLEKAIEEHQRGRTVSSSPKERRSGAFLMSALIADPYRKLIAVGLAMILWLYLDSQVTRETTITPVLQPATSRAQDTPGDGGKNILRVIPLDRRYSILGFEDGNGQISSIEIGLRGTNSKLDDFDTELTALEIELNTEGLDEKTLRLEIRKDDLLVKPTGLKELIDSMEPRTLFVNLVLNAEQKVTIDSERIRWPNGDGRLKLDEAEFTPEQVTLRGPAAALSKFLKEGNLFEAILTANSGESQRRRGSLSLLAPESDGITMQPDYIDVKVAQKPDFQPFKRRVPVKSLDYTLTELEKGSYSFPESIEITLGAASRLASRLNEEDEDWTMENAFVMVTVEARYLASGGSVTGRLFFMGAQYREGTDFQAANPLVKITLKEQ